MTSSGTYSFAPANSDFVINAYARIGIRRTALLQEHLQDAATESNFLLSEWSNKQVNLWKSELQSQLLTQGTATYALPARTVAIMLAYLETGSGQNLVDRVLSPISTTEYASMPNKVQQGQPTVFWFNRLITPEITLWQPPDGNGPYTLKLRCVVQIQDANLPAGETPDIPYRWYDAFTAALAHRLARIWKPELEAVRKADAMEAWQIAATQDVENVPLYIVPGLAPYFR